MIKKGRIAAAFLVAASLFIFPALGNDQGSTKAGPSPKTIDMNAVVCTRLSLIEVQAETKACDWAPLPIDSAIVQAIRETDAFIIRNSPSAVTQQTLDQTRQSLIDNSYPMCKFDPNDRGSGTAFIWAVRQQNSAKFAKGIKEMVSLPLGPGLTPCM